MQRKTPSKNDILKGGYRVIKHHSRTGIAHHPANLLLLCFSVAMRGAAAASWFFDTIPTTIQPLMSIFNKSEALRARHLGVVLLSTIELYHEPNHMLLVMNPIHAPVLLLSPYAACRVDRKDAAQKILLPEVPASRFLSRSR